MLFRLALSVFLGGMAAGAAEADAIRLSGNLSLRHLPLGTVLDPFLDSNNDITGYTRCGDSAIWTGHWLAAEAFRYQVTRDPAALDQVRTALQGIRNLVDVTGYDMLARCYVPVDSPFAEGMLREEQENRNYPGTCLGVACRWVGNTSRDQYIGVFFGLSAAWEQVDDANVKAAARDLITRLLNRLLDDDWAIRMPDGGLSSVFWHRADQKLSLLLTGARVNNGRFGSRYSWERLFQAGSSGASVAAEVLDPHGSYFKFNLNVATYYALIRGESNRNWRRFYEGSYDLMRRTIDSHGNAHFNMIDRALKGPDAARDAETRLLLEQWLTRPRRDERLDLRGAVPSCHDEDRACDPLPVPLRVRSDFLWQRSPFQLVGGGAGNIEAAGIDYMLPYWMARALGVL